MANTLTNRKPLFGNKRSHALNSTNKKQSLNMQKVTINGKQEKMTAREAKKIRKGNK